MGIKFSNLATTTLASGITNSATTITVADGSVFPALGSGDFFFASIDTPPNAPEIVKVTAISSNTLTVVRGQDGTTATSHNSSETIALRVVAAALEDLRDNAGETYTAGSGITLTGTVFSNAAPDQTVSLTGSGATSVSGTYPNFTISSTDTNTDTNTTYTAGTNLSLSGTTFNLNTNLSGLGTISSGAITSTGDITTGYAKTISMDYAPSSGDYHKGMSGLNQSSGTARGLHLFNYDADSNEGIKFWVGTNASRSQALHIASDTNATFAGTISSGAITATGTGTTTAKFTNTSGTGGYVNIMSNVGGVNTDGSVGLHIGWNKSNGGREVNMIFDGGTTQAETEMIFTSTDGSAYTDIFQINGGGNVDIKSGGLRIGTTTVIDSSRNLSNIGTLNGGTPFTTANDGSGSGLDADLLDGVQGSSYLRSDTSDTFGGLLTVSQNGTTGTPSYTNGQIQLITSSNYVPAIGFHRNGYSATTLYESDGELYVNAWVSRAQTGKLVSSGNIGTYAWTSSNDGSGSGLDADLLDGKHASEFVEHMDGSRTNATNLNSYVNSGFYNTGAGTHTNKPSGASDYAQLIVAKGIDTGLQLYGGYTNPTLYVRGWHQSGTFFAWRKLWNDSNDGSGSGLDADLLDGQQGSYYYSSANPPPTYSKYLRSDTDDSFTGNNLFFPTLSLNISNSNAAGSGNAYFRGNSTHFVFGVTSGNTLYMNYGNSAGNFRTEGTITHNSYLVGTLPWGNSNDGSGSGLDADLLDGQQGSYYYSQGSTGMAGTNRITSISNFNNTLPSGWYQSNTASNRPGTSWYNMMNVRHSNTGNDHGFQIAMSYYDNNFWSRSYQGGSGANDGVYQAWAKSWTTANDGSGSGLDADTVDGIQGSSMVQLTANQIITGQKQFRSDRNTTSNSPPLQAYSSGGGGAIMSFHRGGYYAINMGLDSDNVFRIGGWSAGTNRFQMDTSGNLTMAGNVTAYSDIRLKENIKVIPDALSKVQQLRGVTFTRNDTEDLEKLHTGVIAQEVEAVLPEAVSEDNDGIKNVAYGNMVGLLIESIKELKAEVDDLKIQLENK